MNPSPQKISPAGLALIRSFESFAPRRYTCPAGKLTIGYGHVILKGETFPDTITPKEAERLLLADCATAEKIVNGCGYDLEQHEFDALVSFVFNVGGGNFRSSPMRDRLEAGDKAGAAAEFKRWVFAVGKRLKGLEVRREAERKMFLGES